MRAKIGIVIFLKTGILATRYAIYNGFEIKLKISARGALPKVMRPSFFVAKI